MAFYPTRVLLVPTALVERRRAGIQGAIVRSDNILRVIGTLLTVRQTSRFFGHPLLYFDLARIHSDMSWIVLTHTGWFFQQ